MIKLLKSIIKYLKKENIYILIYLFNLSFVSAAEFVSANGENYLVFSQETSGIKKIDFDFMKKGYDIDYVEMGVILDGIPYNLSNLDHKVKFSENSNVIKIAGEIEEFKFQIDIYSSMENKKNLIIRNQILKKGDKGKISFYFSIKPYESSTLSILNDTASYNGFKIKGDNLKFYSTKDTESSNKKLDIIQTETIIQKNQCIFLVEEVDNESYIVLGKDVDHYKSVQEEESFWKQEFKSQKVDPLKISLHMLNNNGVPIDISSENPRIKTKDVLDLIELYLLQKNYSESKKMIEYLLYNTSNDIEGKIPSNYMSFSGKEILKRDNYGVYNSIYIRSYFLNLYFDYLKLSGDSEFFKKSYSLVKTSIIDWIEKNIDKNGVIPDSGNNRVGKDGYKRYVETQYETYKAFSALNTFLVNNGMKNESYNKIASNLKEILILYYIDGFQISDFPFSKEINPKNIFYINDDLFIENSEYYRALQYNIDIIKTMNISINEQIDFVNCLYDKKYYLMAEDFMHDIDKELSGDKGLEILQNDLNLLINYLILKEKEVYYGLNK